VHHRTASARCTVNSPTSLSLLLARPSLLLLFVSIYTAATRTDAYSRSFGFSNQWLFRVTSPAAISQRAIRCESARRTAFPRASRGLKTRGRVVGAVSCLDRIFDIVVSVDRSVDPLEIAALNVYRNAGTRTRHDAASSALGVRYRCSIAFRAGPNRSRDLIARKNSPMRDLTKSRLVTSRQALFARIPRARSSARGRKKGKKEREREKERAEC